MEISYFIGEELHYDHLKMSILHSICNNVLLFLFFWEGKDMTVGTDWGISKVSWEALGPFLF